MRALRRRPSHVLPLVVAASIVCLAVAFGRAQEPTRPTAELIPAPRLSLSGDVDSNSPVVWERIEGQSILHVLTSTAGQPSIARGRDLGVLADSTPVDFTIRPPHGVWMEAVIPDVDGTWYGYYHNEIPADLLCGDPSRTMPRIGAARSTDFGVTWEDLGILLEGPTGSHDCESPNRYFVGGVGDFTAVVDTDARYVYFFFSQYPSRLWRQGVAVARMAWADRDAPAGRLSLWTTDQWLTVEPTLDEDASGTVTTTWSYAPATPIHRATDSWHGPDSSVDAFWGPSVHWNTYLQQYVMLLNRAQDATWRQEGIYVSFAPTLEDPSDWSTPKKVLDGGRWYPQVIGTEPDTGSDRVAGQVARFFVNGRSEHLVRFRR